MMALSRDAKTVLLIWKNEEFGLSSDYINKKY